MDKKDEKKIVHTHAKGLKLTNTWVEDLCIQYKLVPSVITDTLSTVRLLGLSGKQAEKFIELKIDQFDQGKLSLNPWLSRRRKNTNDKSKNSASEIKYRPELSNTSVCLSELSRLLKKQSDAKLIFYGPPGTGKTAFANHLGSQIKRKTQYINASELLNMFVGGTEEKIRDLFHSAEDMGHIVVIDEADSILRSRSEAHRSWEVTQVKQFLSSVEQFKGICIICTNHESSLDPALYRRFDLKIHFGYLHIDQSVELFHELVKKLDFTIDDEEIVRTRLTKLTKLVPGYFNLLARKAKFSTADNDPETLVSMLAEEQQWTSPEPKQIGFIH